MSSTSTPSTNNEWVGDYRGRWLLENSYGDISIMPAVYGPALRIKPLPATWHLRDPIDLW